MSLLGVDRRKRWWVDPNSGGRWRRRGHTGGEALGMRGVCVGEDSSSRSDALVGEAVVDVVRGQEADAAVSMLAVVPVEKGAAMGAAVLRGAEALGKVGPVLERLELRLGERIVVRDARPRVALRDAEVGVEMGHHLRGHRRPTVSVDRELTGRDALALA